MATSNQPQNFGLNRIERLHHFQDFVHTASYKGFARTIVILTLLFVLSFLFYFVAKTKSTYNAPLAKHSITLTEFTNTSQKSQAVPVKTFSTFHNLSISQSTFKSVGIPIPTLKLESATNFNQIDLPSTSSTLPSTNVGEWGIGNVGTENTIEQPVQNVHREEVIPSIDEFISTDKEPKVDIAQLQKYVVYPDLGLRAGIQGTVVVRALILSSGTISTIVVLSSDSDILNEAAISAVKKSVFTPAIQGNSPINCWITIPIVFQLR